MESGDCPTRGCNELPGRIPTIRWALCIWPAFRTGIHIAWMCSERIPPASGRGSVSAIRNSSPREILRETPAHPGRWSWINLNTLAGHPQPRFWCLKTSYSLWKSQQSFATVAHTRIWAQRSTVHRVMLVRASLSIACYSFFRGCKRTILP